MKDSVVSVVFEGIVLSLFKRELSMKSSEINIVSENMLGQKNIIK